jgi:hypothetical protein
LRLRLLQLLLAAASASHARLRQHMIQQRERLL